jgi:predicted alpha/beta-hydrolase family hydrolase
VTIGVPAPDARSLTISVDSTTRVSALLLAPPRASACFVFAHGAGAGMAHPFMAAVSAGLAERGIASLRYQFPYMEKGGKRPDPPKVAHAAVRAAVAEARQQLPDVPLIAGGKSFGGRMTSQMQALAPLEGVVGLAFLGFPLHPAKQPSQERAKHLVGVTIPMLFLQGTRDALAELGELEPVCAALGSRTTLKLFADADHSFHVPARTGRKDAEVRAEMLDVFAAWAERIAGNSKRG